MARDCGTALFLLCTLALFWLAGGCAAPQRPVAEATPASPKAGRDEISTLTQEIQHHRAALGLLPSTTRSSSLPPPRDQGLRQAAPEAEPPPAAPLEAAPSAARKEDAQAEADVAGVEDSAEPCAEPCRLTRAICRAAQRICRIAQYLQEDDARRRCQQAQLDCQEAEQTTRGQCRGCPE